MCTVLEIGRTTYRYEGHKEEWTELPSVIVNPAGAGEISSVRSIMHTSCSTGLPGPALRYCYLALLQIARVFCNRVHNRQMKFLASPVQRIGSSRPYEFSGQAFWQINRR